MNAWMQVRHPFSRHGVHAASLAGMAWLAPSVASAGAPPPDLRTIEDRATDALAGPAGCHTLHVASTQSASIPLLGTDTETVRMTAQLSGGTWRVLEERLVSDSDPDQRIYDEGPLLMGEPGMGSVPGAKPGDPEAEALFAALLSPAAELRWKSGRIERRTEGLGWASTIDVVDGVARGLRVRLTGDEPVDWHIRWTADGLPVHETTHASFSVMGIPVTVKQSVDYTVAGSCDG